MRHYLGLCVALGLIATVTTATTATAGPPKTRVEVVINQEGVSYINLTASGTNGLLKGTGTMKIGKAATYPMTVESGTYTTERRSSNSGGGSSSGGSGGGSASSVNGTVTLNGFIRRQGRKVPFVLEGETESGDATLTCTVTTTTTSGGTTTTTTSDVDSDWTGRIRIKF